MVLLGRFNGILIKNMYVFCWDSEIETLMHILISLLITKYLDNFRKHYLLNEQDQEVSRIVAKFCTIAIKCF